MLSAEEAQDRQNALARMRSLLLRHGDKARHLKKIKSKDYHRRTNRAAKLKAGHWLYHSFTFVCVGVCIYNVCVA